MFRLEGKQYSLQLPLGLSKAGRFDQVPSKCQTTECVLSVVDGTNLLVLAMKFGKIISKFIPTSVLRQIVVSCNNAAAIFLSNVYRLGTKMKQHSHLESMGQRVQPLRRSLEFWNGTCTSKPKFCICHHLPIRKAVSSGSTISSRRRRCRLPFPITTTFRVAKSWHT